MNMYDYFESGQALVGVRLGLISISSLVKYDIYKTYLHYCKKYPTTREARKMTMIKCACEKETLTKAIKFFERSTLPIFATNGKQ